MRRALTVLVLLALMGGFAFGVNRFFAAHRHAIVNAVRPTATHPAFTLPGTIYLAQQGAIYRLSGVTFTNLHLPQTGTWMQPVVVPGTNDIVAVLRSAAYSDLYLIDGGSGQIIRQLTHNATRSRTIQLNHWMFWPRVGADGVTLWVSYDAPKSPQSYEIDFAIWRGTLTGNAASRRWTVPFSYTGGDTDAIPLSDGRLLYAKYQINGGNVFSRIAVQAAPQAFPAYLTAPTDDCGEPALSPDGVTLAMICSGGTGLQSTRLEVATLQGNTLVDPRILLPSCLCAAPAWAPDGSGLVYDDPVDATGHFQLWWIANAAGPVPGVPRVVTHGLDLDATSPVAWR